MYILFTIVKISLNGKRKKSYFKINIFTGENKNKTYNLKGVFEAAFFAQNCLEAKKVDGVRKEEKRAKGEI
jgi:hypothetical protein